MWLLLACSDPSNLNLHDPQIVLSPASMGFAEVVVGNRLELGVTVRNEGYGSLLFDEVSLDGMSSPDFQVMSWPDAGLGHDEEGVLSVAYAPAEEGGDLGVVLLDTNIPDADPTEVKLEGIGVIPRIDVDPEVLYFGIVPVGTSATLSTRVSAAGTGDLRVSHIGFAAQEDLAYDLVVPGDWEHLPRGYSYTLDVTFTPPDDAEYIGEIWIESNDPAEPVAAVHLIGNSVDDPTENEPPVVEILDPDNGEYFLDDVAVALSGYVYDADEPASNLLCGWFVDGTRVGSVTPGSDGEVTESSVLPVGSVSLALRCYDSEGSMGEDTAALTVWAADEPLVYTLSGGPSIFEFFSVDDDLSITLGGVEIYADVDRTRTTLPPVAFEASRGAVIGLLATDQNYCDMSIDALVLHWGTGVSQPLNDALCASACSDHACYTGDYNGPWPGVFLDETYEIAVP